MRAAQMNLWIDERMHRAVKVQAFAEQGTMSDLIRRAILQYLDAAADDEVRPMVDELLDEVQQGVQV